MPLKINFKLKLNFLLIALPLCKAYVPACGNAADYEFTLKAVHCPAVFSAILKPCHPCYNQFLITHQNRK